VIGEQAKKIKKRKKIKVEKDNHNAQQIKEGTFTYNQNASKAYDLFVFNFNKLPQIQGFLRDHYLQFHRYEISATSGTLTVIFYLKRGSTTRARIQVQTTNYIDLNEISTANDDTEEFTMADVAIANMLVLYFFVDALHNERTSRFKTLLPASIGFSLPSDPAFLTNLNVLGLEMKGKEVDLSKFTKS